VRIIVMVVILVLAAIQLIPVDRTNPPVQAVVAAPPEVFGVLERACFDCHSNQTRWPWYSYVAPVSWFIAHDVEEARHELNFTEWNALSPKEQAHEISECWEHVQEGKMPLPAYARMHAEARLTDGEKALIRDWAMVAGEGPSGAEGDDDHSGDDD
jgi:hypothetical protein